MRTIGRTMLYVSVFCAVALLPVLAGAQLIKKRAKTESAKPEATISAPKLPEAVKKTFDGKFPNAAIEKAESEKEGGVMVWDIEFRDGRKHKETDIAEDGTMIEFSEQVAQKAVPKDAMKSIKKAAEGGKLNRTEKVTLSCEIKDGKVIKLDKPKTQYEANVTKGEQSSDIIVDEKGKMIEAPKWEAPKATEKKSA